MPEAPFVRMPHSHFQLLTSESGQNHFKCPGESTEDAVLAQNTRVPALGPIAQGPPAGLLHSVLQPFAG